MKLLFILLFLTAGLNVWSQVAINSDASAPDNSAMLDVKSIDKGLLLPRMTRAQRDAIITPAQGLVVYMTDNTPGLYYNSGSGASPAWVMAGNGSGWGLTGNSGTSAGSNFIGTTDNVPLVFKVNNLLAGKIDQLLLNTSFGYVSLNSNTNGEQNTALGCRSLYSNTEGSYNTASGTNALSFNTTGNGNTAHGSFALYSNTTGGYNTTTGLQSMFLNTTGSNNTATGAATLYNNTTGSYNTATGHSALTYNTTGSNNTANGYFALNYNTNGYENTAIGVNALYFNTSGFQNTAVGMGALYANTSGIYNTSTGWESLYSNTTGGYNTADGYWALSYNTSGYRNTSTGFRSLTFNSTGANNTAHGADALLFNTEGFQNTAIGANSLYFNTMGAYNTAVGFNTGPGSGFLFNTTCLGIDAIATGSDMVRIGNIYVGSIGGYQNWTNISDSRFKENVKENVPGLSFINQLRPVTYQLNRDKINEFNGVSEAHSKLKEQDPSLEFLKGDKYGQVTTGFIAQEVEAVAKSIGFEFSGVDAPNNENDFYGLRYAEFVVPLVKAVQELDLHDSSIRLILKSQQTAIESQRLTMETQTKIIEKQQQQIDELRTMVIEIQKTNK